MDQSCFHLSIPAIDLALSRHWYEQVLGCRAGRCSDEALILDLGGHQLVLQRHCGEGKESFTWVVRPEWVEALR